MNIKSTIATWVRRARKEAGLSGEELGTKLDLMLGTKRGHTKGNISHWELGRHEPSLQQLIAISKITGIDLPSELLKEIQKTDDTKKANAIDNMMETTANRIAQALIQKNGGNQSEMARFIGVSPQAVQKWINGETEPKGKNLELAAEFLGTTAAILMFGNGAQPSNFGAINNIDAENKSKKKAEVSEIDDILLFIEAYKKSSPANRKILMRSVKTAIELSESSTASHKSRIFKNQA